MRLIDADAFENYVFDEWQKNDVSNGDWITFREWLKDQETVVEFEGEINKVVVRGVEYVKPEQKWIPCSERLPEESQDVLVCTKYQGITDGMHKRGTWWIAWGERCYEDEENLILAWMPLPEPWRGEEE